MPFIKQSWLRKFSKREKQQKTQDHRDQAIKRDEKATEIKEIDNDIFMIKNGIKMAEKSIKEGNLEL